MVKPAARWRVAELQEDEALLNGQSPISYPGMTESKACWDVPNWHGSCTLWFSDTGAESLLFMFNGISYPITITLYSLSFFNLLFGFCTLVPCVSVCARACVCTSVGSVSTHHRKNSVDSGSVDIFRSFRGQNPYLLATFSLCLYSLVQPETLVSHLKFLFLDSNFFIMISTVLFWFTVSAD